MTDDFLDFMDVGPYSLDFDLNDVPDVHEMSFVPHPDGTGSLPGAIDPHIDADGDGIPDSDDPHIDLDGQGLDYRTHLDSGGDGMNDWVDPYSQLPGQGLTPEFQLKLALELDNPHF